MLSRICVWSVALLATISLTAGAADWPVLVLQESFGGFSRPVQLTHAGDGSGLLYVVEQEGRVRVVEGDQVLATPLLDISDRVSCCGERGLLGIAFPPGFAAKRYFYADYTDGSGDTVVSRFHLAGSSPVADPSSEQVLLRIDQPFANHNGGQLAFGPDGYLYIGTGDGGSGGDPMNNAQDPLSLLGKILRIDVESGELPYGVPDSNPFAFDDGHQPEIWAMGLRNPWRFSFDPSSGDLFIADVGQGRYEEVNLQPGTSPGGENYGWRIMEGSHCFDPDPCSTEGLVSPVAEYDHALGCSVTGGQVYRGARWPRLDGVYLYGDYCSGRIWGLRRGQGGWQSRLLSDTELEISAFGVDELGVVYVVDYGSGRVYSISDPAVSGSEKRSVPAVAHLFGSGGTPWRADLVVSNPWGRQAQVELVFRGSGLELEGSSSIPPGGSTEWRDVLVSLFGLDPAAEAAGVVEVRSELPLAVSARSYATTEGGSFGQFLPGLGPDDGVGPGARGVIPKLSRSSERYTNIGFFNPGVDEIRLSLIMRDGGGAPLGEPDVIELAGGEWVQLFDVLARFGDREGVSAIVELLTPEGRVWAYASIIDRESRDPTTVPVQLPR
jgi:glucose/arabinose dehydrogenase